MQNLQLFALVLSVSCLPACWHGLTGFRSFFFPARCLGVFGFGTQECLVIVVAATSRNVTAPLLSQDGAAEPARSGSCSRGARRSSDQACRRGARSGWAAAVARPSTRTIAIPCRRLGAVSNRMRTEKRCASRSQPVGARIVGRPEGAVVSPTSTPRNGQDHRHGRQHGGCSDHGSRSSSPINDILLTNRTLCCCAATYRLQNVQKIKKSTFYSLLQCCIAI